MDGACRPQIVPTAAAAITGNENACRHAAGNDDGNFGLPAPANGFDNALDDISTCIDHLAPRGPVFVVGYCYGGTLAWMAACKLGDLAAVSSYYGSQVHNHAHDVARCPVILHFGTKDNAIPLAQVEGIIAARPDLEIHLYEDGHGFNNRDGAAAHLARRRTLELFEQNGAG